MLLNLHLQTKRPKQWVGFKSFGELDKFNFLKFGETHTPQCTQQAFPYCTRSAHDAF